MLTDLVIGDLLDLEVEGTYPCSDGSITHCVSVDKLVLAAYKKGQTDAQQEGIDAANAYSDGAISFERWAERMDINFYELASACRKYWQSLKEKE